jgi:hypothetical protein
MGKIVGDGLVALAREIKINYLVVFVLPTPHTRTSKLAKFNALRHLHRFTMARTKQTGRKSTGGRVPAADIPAMPSTQQPHISPMVLPPNGATALATTGPLAKTSQVRLSQYPSHPFTP